jgi:hypothetical protein
VTPLDKVIRFPDTFELRPELHVTAQAIMLSCHVSVILTQLKHHCGKSRETRSLTAETQVALTDMFVDQTACQAGAIPG